MKTKKYFIGIDGGGTKSFIRIVDSDDNIIIEKFGKSTNLCSNSEDVVKSNLIELFSNINLDTLDSICLGTAGITKLDADKILSKIITDITGCEKVKVIGDMQIPLYANAFEDDAISLVSGTGSVCFGRTKDDLVSRSGGWGHIFDDFGSGYWIACQGLSIMMKAFDGRCPKNLLTKLLLEKYECSNETQIISKIYSSEFSKNEIASNAILVFEATENGDIQCKNILNKAAENLAELVIAVANNLGFENKSFKILFSGSILIKNEYVNLKTADILKKIYPKAIISNIKKDAAWGAINVAKFL